MLVKLKKSTTSGDVPTISELEQGEVAINVPDGFIFMKRVNGSERVVTFRPWTGEYANVAIIESTYNLPLDNVQSSLIISLDQIVNYLSLSSCVNGYVGRLIVKQNDDSYRLKAVIGTNILNEIDAVSYKSFGYSAQTVSEVTGNTNATLRTATAHGYSVGDYVYVNGFSGDKTAYNGLHRINELVDASSFIIDQAYEASGSSSSPTVVKYELCYNVNGVSMFEIIKDSTNIYIRKLGDFA